MTYLEVRHARIHDGIDGRGYDTDLTGTLKTQSREAQRGGSQQRTAHLRPEVRAAVEFRGPGLSKVRGLPNSGTRDAASQTAEIAGGQLNRKTVGQVKRENRPEPRVSFLTLKTGQ